MTKIRFRKLLVRKLMVPCLAAVALCLCTTSTFAETPGKHPAYLHARSDLAKARQLLRQPGEEGNVAAQLRNAMGEVNHAIVEIDSAVELDLKDIIHNPS